MGLQSVVFFSVSPKWLSHVKSLTQEDQRVLGVNRLMRVRKGGLRQSSR